MTLKFRQEVARVCNEITGWCTPEKALRLCELIEEKQGPKAVVEIGVWAGRSLIPMAMACREFGGTAFAIDPWDAMQSVKDYDSENAHWWGSQDHEMVFRLFTDKVAAERLQDHVIVIRAASDDVPVFSLIDILHIDGQHTEQAIRDVHRFASRVPVGGIVVMDDVGWTNDGVPHVSIAVHHLLEMGFGHGEPLEAGAVFRRERLSCAPGASRAMATASAGL